MRVLNAKDSRPFAVCLYVGQGKPKSVRDYFRQFLVDMKRLMEHGITIDGTHYVVELSHWSCDAPARQFVKCIAGHCSKYGCERCTQLGVRINGNNRMSKNIFI